MVYIFDMFDTLVNVNKIDFKNGLKILWQLHFSQACTFEEFVSFNDELYLQVKNSKSAQKEYPFVSHYVPALCKQFNVPDIEVDIALEWSIVESIADAEVKSETMAKLQELKATNAQIYILTNSMFRAEALSGFLRKFKIDYLIDHMFSSADFLVRKPDVRFFSWALDYINQCNLSLSRGDITFVGNSYKHDIIGGCDAGLNVVWLNVEHAANCCNLPIRIIDNMSQL